VFKEYYPIDGDSSRKYLLKGTTARVEAELKEIGLVAVSPDNPNDADANLSKILNEGGEPLIRLCNAIFRGEPFTSKDELDIDKHIVKEAVLDFFYKDAKFLQILADYTKTLSLPLPSQT
jgi:hypothetical protein